MSKQERATESRETTEREVRSDHEISEISSPIELLEAMGDAGGLANFKVSRRAPQRFRGYITTFLVDLTEEGMTGFFEDLRACAGGGLFSVQVIGEHGGSKFGKTRSILISGDPKHYEREREPEKPVQQSPAPQYIPIPPPVQSSSQPIPDALMGIMRDLIERQGQQGTLSKDDLLEVFRSAMPVASQAPPVRDAMAGLREAMSVAKEIREVFGGEDAPSYAPEGGDGLVSMLKTFGPLVLQFMQQMRSQPQIPQYPGWQGHMGGPPWSAAPQHPYPQPPYQPQPHGTQAPPASEPSPPTAPGSFRSPDSPADERHRAGVGDPPEPPEYVDGETEYEDGGYIDGPLTAQEIGEHFASASQDEQITIISTILPAMGLDLTPEQVTEFLASVKASSGSTETADPPSL